MNVGDVGCENDFDCLNGNCWNNTCSAYFSLPVGTLLGADTNFCSIRNETHFCESGQCSYNSTASSYECIYGYHSFPDSVPVTCTHNSNCTAINRDNNYAQGTCSCGYNTGGTAYCYPFMDDIEGQEYIDYFKTFVNEGGFSACNTQRRYNPICWSASKGYNFYENFLAAFRTKTYFSQIYENDQCVKDLITNPNFPPS